MALKKSGESKLGDLLFDALEEGIVVAVDALRKGIFRPFPIMMKKISHKLFMKYVWLTVFCFAGILILGMGIGELITQFTAITKGFSYAIVGMILIIFGVILYKDKINII